MTTPATTTLPFTDGDPVIIRCRGRHNGKPATVHSVVWWSTLQRDIAWVRIEGEAGLNAFGLDRLERADG